MDQTILLVVSLIALGLVLGLVIKREARSMLLGDLPKKVEDLEREMKARREWESKIDDAAKDAFFKTKEHLDKIKEAADETKTAFEKFQKDIYEHGVERRKSRAERTGVERRKQ